jgi:hypothetical protein
MIGSEEYPDEWDNFSRHAVVTPSRKHRSAGAARATQQHFVKICDTVIKCSLSASAVFRHGVRYFQSTIATMAQ